MLTLAAHTVRSFFLMKNGNPYHHPDFVKNHATGIVFQGKVEYTTWFGRNPEHIHGIQMLPLSPALQLTRRPDFCQQEWDDVLSKVDLNSMRNPWKSVLLTGGLAVIKPKLAYDMLRSIEEGSLDNGLTRAWALYWTATEPGLTASAASVPRVETTASLLLPVRPAGGSAPDARVFAPVTGPHPTHPSAHTEVAGVKSTNKFWTNWLVPEGAHFPIFPMPYVLKWGGTPEARRLAVAHSTPHKIYDARLGPNRMRGYITNSVPEFELGAKEATSGDFVAVSEGLFGVHIEVRGAHHGKILFPIYSGMAYVSGKYSGGLTPTISHPHGLQSVAKVAPGIWSFVNRRNVEFRVYVLNEDGSFVGDAVDFDASGRLNQEHVGWVRLAHVIAPSDKQALDKHAPAVVLGCELEVEAGGTVRYSFQKAGPPDVTLLHFAYGHHVELMSPGRSLSSAEAPSASKAGRPLFP
jgi:endoglucanase Acf2